MKTMIGVLDTTNPKTGQRVTIQYKRFNGIVTITGISDSSGMDILGNFSSTELQEFKNKILTMSR